MTASSSHTIAALATPEGVGAVAMIRVSGAQAFSVVNRLFPAKDLTKLPSHTVHLGEMVENGHVIDQVLLTIFRSPRSYTGEDTVEIGSHGSPYIARSILSALCRCGARMAMPGEFTQRAFLHGKIDLTQAESVCDLIHAQSKVAQETALSQLKGGVSSSIKSLREEVIRLTSLLELELDFGEEDVHFASREELHSLATALQSEINTLLQSFATGCALKEGVAVTIAGAPNAGKSTLLNALLREERAIVSDVAGTTRDLIEAPMVLDGVQFRLTDTAGLRATKDPVEQLGIQRTKRSVRTAKVVLYLFDITKDDPTTIRQAMRRLRRRRVKHLCYANKKDAVSGSVRDAYNKLRDIPLISAHNEHDVQTIREALRQEGKRWQQHEGVIISSVRQYQALAEALAAINRVVEHLPRAGTELLAADLRFVTHHLQCVVGEVTNEEVLNDIFSKFCIGK